MKSTMVSVKETLDRHETAIKETHDAQLSCVAAGGWGRINQEMKQVHIRAQKDRDSVEDKLKELRGEQTGQFDVPMVPRHAIEAKTNGNMVMGFLKTFGPWIAVILFGLGMIIGNGGDGEETLKVLREFGFRLGKVETKRAETIHVPVPITLSDAYSEEILP